MARRRQPFYFQIAAPSAGIDTFAPSTMIDERKTPDAENVRFEGGVVFKRSGYTVLTSQGVTWSSGIGSGALVNSVASGPVLIDDFQRLDGTNTPLLATCTKLYKHTGTAWQAIKTGLIGTLGGRHSATIMNDVWVYTNAVNHVQKWTGTGDASDLLGGSDYQTGNWHLARAVQAFADRLLLLGTNEDGTDRPYRVRWSELSKLEEWNENEGGGYADLREDPTGIQGAELLGNWCAIYCGRSIWLATYIGGAVVFRFDRIIPNVGCSAPRTIVDLGYAHIFMGDDDIYQFDGAQLTSIGQPIRKELFPAVARSNRMRCHAALNRDTHTYHLYLPYGNDEGKITKSYVYDYQEGTWTADSVANLTAAAAVQMGKSITIDEMDTLALTIDELQGETIDGLGGESGKHYRLVADSGGRVFQDDGRWMDDYQTAVDAWWQSKDLPISGEYIDRLKRVQQVLYEAKGNAVSVHYSTDFGVSWTKLVDQALANDYVRYKCDMDRSCRQIRLRFRNQTSGQRFYLRWLGLKGYVESDR